jgi:hypothetical protein
VRRLGISLGCLALLVLAIAPSASFARGKPHTRIDEFVFRTSGTDDYRVTFDAFRVGSDVGRLNVVAARGGVSAAYSESKVSWEDRSIAGRVGSLGSVDVHFRISSVSRRARDLSTATLTPRMPLSGTGQYSDQALTGSSANFLDDPFAMPVMSPRARLKRTYPHSAAANCGDYGEQVIIYPRGTPRISRVSASLRGSRIAAALARAPAGFVP